MKAMFIGFAAAIVIAVIVGVVLDQTNPDSARSDASADVRLD